MLIDSNLSGAQALETPAMPSLAWVSPGLASALAEMVWSPCILVWPSGVYLPTTFLKVQLLLSMKVFNGFSHNNFSPTKTVEDLQKRKTKACSRCVLFYV